MSHTVASRAIRRLRKMTDDQLHALSDDEFWGAIEPDGICPHCDPGSKFKAVTVL